MPAAFFAAGLPHASEHINEAVSFSERFDYQQLGMLLEDDAEVVLAQAAQELGVSWTPEALRTAARAAEGYPYKVQLIGDAAWQAAGRPDPGGTIAEDSVVQGMKSVDAQMAELFRSRWSSSAEAQQAMLLTIAELGGTNVKRADLAKRLGLSTTSISVTRDHLLRRGIVEATQRARLSLSIPGFATWILEHHEEPL